MSQLALVHDQYENVGLNASVLTIAKYPHPALVDHEHASFESPSSAVTIDNLIAIAFTGINAMVEELIQCSADMKSR